MSFVKVSTGDMTRAIVPPAEPDGPVPIRPAKLPVTPSAKSDVIVARPGWSAAILVCGKCLKGVDGKAMRRDLKAAARSRTGKVRIVRTACLGVCPRRAVAMASARTLARRELVVLREGRSAAAALDRLLPPDAPERS